MKFFPFIRNREPEPSDETCRLVEEVLSFVERKGLKPPKDTVLSLASEVSIRWESFEIVVLDKTLVMIGNQEEMKWMCSSELGLTEAFSKFLTSVIHNY